MMKSMTGFASVAAEDARAALGVSVKTLNHRYLDVQIKMPAWLNAAEAAVRAAIGTRVARGRVEVALSVQTRESLGVEVELNRDVARALESALATARAEGWVSGLLTPEIGRAHV